MGALMDWLLGPAEEDDDEEGAEDERYTATDGCDGPDLDCACGLCRERWRVAIHEAGHLVAFETLGQPWEFAEITPDDTGLSYSAGGQVSSVKDTDDLAGHDVYDYLVICQAGHAAEHAVFGQINGSQEDLNMIDDLGARWGDPDGPSNAQADAETLIGDHWHELHELAEELFTEGTVYP